MPQGGGKYEAECTAARTSAKARGAILIILDGEHGSGFSVQAPFDVMLSLPQILEGLAADIRGDIREGKQDA